MRYLLFLFLCLPFVLMSQDQPPKSGFKFYYGLDYNNRFFVADNENSWITDILQENEIPDFGNAYGLVRIQQFTHPKWSLEYGIGISERRITTHPIQGVFVDDNTFPRSSLVHDYSYHYVVIPVHVNYMLINSPKFSIKSSIGFQKNFFRYASHRFVLIQGDQKTDRGSNRFDYKRDWSIHLGLELTYKLMDGIHLSLQPNFNQAITSGEPSEFFKAYFNSFGVSLGVIILGR